MGVMGLRPSRGWPALTAVRDVVLTPWRAVHPLALMRANKSLFGLNLLELAERAPEMVRRAIDAVDAFWTAGQLRPTLDSVLPMAAAGAAQERLSHRVNVGKVVLTIDGKDGHAL
jgi:NADPH:quinone reductase-like Zn-dependent oxidoreductase